MNVLCKPLFGDFFDRDPYTFESISLFSGIGESKRLLSI